MRLWIRLKQTKVFHTSLMTTQSNLDILIFD